MLGSVLFYYITLCCRKIGSNNHLHLLPTFSCNTIFFFLQQKIVLQENVANRRKWLLDPIHGYSVRDTYRLSLIQVGRWIELRWMMSGIGIFLSSVYVSLTPFPKQTSNERQFSETGNSSLYGHHVHNSRVREYGNDNTLISSM